MKHHWFVLGVAAVLAVGAPALSGPWAAAGAAPPLSRSAAPALTSPAVVHRNTACPDNLAQKLRSTDGAAQLMTVVAANFQATVAQVAIWQREGHCWKPAGGPWTGLIGENGFSNHHREGDGTTPTGIYTIGPVVYGNDPNPGYRGRYHRLVCGDWWDEDPTSPAYNTFQHVPCGESPPFGGDSEPLWTETTYYPSFAVVEYNAHPVVAYAGSAIFVHADTGAPTTGCVSIPLGDLDAFLRWLDPARLPTIVMAPASELSGY
ncbi:MAG TPA: L,D-transpeptidase family protein [Acidimicrobiales bacterium]|nr:L,D-transpeptidase family protein [Acidimicrobiales bacterium]